MNSGETGYIPSTYVELEENVEILKAMYDYAAREVNDVDMKKNDKLVFVK